MSHVDDIHQAKGIHLNSKMVRLRNSDLAYLQEFLNHQNFFS